jgi:hypothetical protein
MTPLDRSEEKLKLLNDKYQRLTAIPAAERSVEQINELLELGDEIDTLDAKLVKLRKRANVTEDEAKAAAAEAQASMAAFVCRYDVYYVSTSDLWFYKEHGEWHSVKPRAFSEKFRVWLPDGDAREVFYNVLDLQERKMNVAHYAWEERDGYLNLLSMDQFCEAVPANGYHAAFDLLFHSLGGGKKENIEHLERVLLSKWQHPENHLLPCLVLADGGGTGKSLLLSGVAPVTFGKKNVADNLSIEMAFGKFNRSIAGKAIAFVNEAPEDREDDKGILRTIHSPTINIEAKGRDPIQAANTALYVISSNPKSGYAVRLAHSDVDRRFSIIFGGKPLRWHVAEFYGLSHDNEDEAGHNKVVDELQHVLSDPKEVGRWLYCKELQYGDVASVRALHGTDYKKQSADTEDMHTRVFDAIFQAEGFSYVRSELLFKFYQSNGGTYKNIGFNRLARVYLEEHPELKITYDNFPWAGRVQGYVARESTPKRYQARVFIKDAASYTKAGEKTRLADNDQKYGEEDTGGRWVFHQDVV